MQISFQVTFSEVTILKEFYSRDFRAKTLRHHYFTDYILETIPSIKNGN